MKNSIQWVKVSVVSGVLIAGFMSFSDSNLDSETKVFQALVGWYSIERRQWVEIGTWFCHIVEKDGKPVMKEDHFHPTNESGFYLDARQMNVHWQGDYECFAHQCQMWIQKTLNERGLLSRNLDGHHMSSGMRIPTEEERETVNEAFHCWCRRVFLSHIQRKDQCE